MTSPELLSKYMWFALLFGKLLKHKQNSLLTSSPLASVFVLRASRLVVSSVLLFPPSFQSSPNPQPVSSKERYKVKPTNGQVINLTLLNISSAFRLLFLERRTLDPGVSELEARASSIVSKIT